MARNEEVRIPGHSPITDGKLYPEIIKQIDEPHAGLNTLLVGEGHEIVFKGIHRSLVVGTNGDEHILSEAFAVITPVVFTGSHEDLNDSKVSEDGFTFENLQADLNSGLVHIAEPIEVMQAHTKSGAFVRQIEVTRLIASGSPDEALKLFNHLSQWIVAASTGLSNAANTNADIPSGHGRTADSVYIPDNTQCTVAQVVDTNDFSTANIMPDDSVAHHETIIGTLTIGPHVRNMDGTTDFMNIPFSVRGPEFRMASRAAGFIVQTSGQILEVYSEHKQSGADKINEFYDGKLRNVL